MKTIKETKLGDFVLRLVETGKEFAGVVISGKEIKARENGTNPDEVWRQLHDAAVRLNPLFIGYSSARARFLHFFTEGFSGDYFSREERAYKLKAKEKLDESLPLSTASNGKGLGEAALAAFRATNLLFPVEKAQMKDLLRGPDADLFVRLSAEFAEGDTKVALEELRVLLKSHNCAKWTVVTYLPFLWKPEIHMFLKPMVMKTFAERVGHRFANDYVPELDITVYESLLDLANQTGSKIADLGPRDMIDIQSFIWTVVEYKEEDMTTSSE